MELRTVSPKMSNVPMFERPCEVLIRKTAEIEWAENQIEEKAYQLREHYNRLISHGLDPRVARAEYTETMRKVCDHFLPIYNRATPHVTFTVQIKT